MKFSKESSEMALLRPFRGSRLLKHLTPYILQARELITPICGGLGTLKLERPPCFKGLRSRSILKIIEVLT